MKRLIVLLAVLLPVCTVFSLRIQLNPNPYKISSGTLSIGVDNPWGGNVRYECRIFDMSGRLVLSMSSPNVSDPTYWFPAWDGQNKSGMRVYSGVYIVHVTAESTTLNKEDKMKMRLGVLQQ